MPKSKRDKIVSLTKVKKKTKETKGKLIDEVRVCLSKYNNLFVFSTANLRSNILIKVRQHFKETSRIFYGRNSVMAVALGKTPEQEVENGLCHVAQMLKGPCGLIFTNEKKTSICRFFEEFVEEEFARAGDSAPFEIVFPAGPVHIDDDGIDDEEHKKWVTGSFEPQLRKLGLQTRLNNGKIELLEHFVVCKERDKLSSDQTKILRHFGRRLVEFRITLLAHWSKKKGFKKLKELKESILNITDEMEQN